MISFSTTPEINYPEYWFPSTVNQLSQCFLQFAFSRDVRFSSVLKRSNTYTSLGSAAHRLTEAVWRGDFALAADDEIREMLNSSWEELVEKEYKKLQQHWSGRDVPVPKEWPFYSITRAKTIRRLLAEIARHQQQEPKSDQHHTSWIEKEFVDEELQLKGIPDRVITQQDGFYVFDIKTGHSISEISTPYRRQLLLYAHLVAQNTGLKPLAMAIIRAGGETIWENISSQDIQNCLDEVKTTTEAFVNTKSEDILSTASPSPDVCRFCDYKVVCKAYWEDLNPSWEDYRGVVGEIIEVIDKSTFKVRQILPANNIGREVGISNLPSSYTEGDHVAIVDGFLRDNGLRGEWYSKILKVDLK